VGWHILLLWLVAIVLLGAWHRYQKYRANAYRREAQKRLLEITKAPKTDISNGIETGYAIAVLLKQTALAAYPRHQVASLYGARWADFLRSSSNNDSRVCAVADRLAFAAYRKDVKIGDRFDGHSSVRSETDLELAEAAAQWIKVHQTRNTQGFTFD
jgi:hypothetical protein